MMLSTSVPCSDARGRCIGRGSMIPETTAGATCIQCLKVSHPMFDTASGPPDGLCKRVGRP
jgi:hypothetical protein